MNREQINQSKEQALKLQQLLLERVDENALTSDSLLTDLKTFAYQLQELITQTSLAIISSAESTDDLMKIMQVFQVQTKLIEGIGGATEESSENFETMQNLQTWLSRVLNTFADANRIKEFSISNNQKDAEAIASQFLHDTFKQNQQLMKCILDTKC